MRQRHDEIRKVRIPSNPWEQGKVYSFALLALLIATPLAALDVSSVKQGAPVRHGNSWQQVSEFEAPTKEGARLLLRADNGTVSIRPGPGDKVSCAVTLRAYTSDEAKARRLFDTFQLSARSVEAGGIYITSQSPRRCGHHGSNFRVQLSNHRTPTLQPGRGNAGWRHHGGSPLEGEARLTTAGGDVRTSDIYGPGAD